MKPDKKTNAIKRFFKNDYYHIYLRSGVWSEYPELGNQECLRCYQSIKQAVSGCSTNSQQILKYRYQQRLKVKEVTSKINLSQSGFYKRNRQALQEFTNQLNIVAPDLLDAIQNEYN